MTAPNLTDATVPPMPADAALTLLHRLEELSTGHPGITRDMALQVIEAQDAAVVQTSEVHVTCVPDDHNFLLRVRRAADGRWMVLHGDQMCLSLAGEWVYNSPTVFDRAGREAWFAQHRYASYEEAVAAARRAAPFVTAGEFTAVEWLNRPVAS